ncbi:MAG: spore maturation protein A [Clostridiales bacterium]|jgi:spore maturation protein A|nr:spore maturation protein A [Clostridiales bacterium]
MNKIWSFIIILSLALLLAVGPDKALTGMIEASNEALALSLRLLAVYAVWLGILSIVEHTGLSDALSRLLKPAIRFLFGKNISPETEKYISVNMSANLLGMGGAATPMGIKAIASMDDGGGVATDAMIMLFVLNASGISLIPTTLIGLRSAAGSASPADIILPTLIAVTASAAFGVAAVKAIQSAGRKRRRRRK